VHIRTDLRPGDIGEVVRLHGLLYAKEYHWDHTFEAYVAESLARFALNNDPTRERIWLVEAGGRVTGSIGIVAAEEDVAQLRWFLVAPSARGKGVGGTLLQHAIGFSRAANYGSIFLWTVDGLSAAAHLYKQAGFVLTEERRGLHWGAEVTEQRFELTLRAE
jgi:GNAT superfamily N-acetyltransferase